MADRAARVLTHPLLSLQRKDGSWEGEVVWCTMILSQYVIVRQIVGRRIDAAEREQIHRHYAATRTAEGGWALHREGPPQIFTTTLAYVALRIAGVDEDDELVAPARRWLRAQPGGVLGIPTWGKFWLAMIDLYGYDGVSALPPELFLLPASVPFHPSRWYCHTRYIYLGMAYLYGRRFVADLGPLRDALRRELYDESYGAIDFAASRQYVSPIDRYAPPAPALARFHRIAAALERRCPPALRRRALAWCFERILYEQRESRYQGLSPVNGLLNGLAIFATDPEHPELRPSLDGVEAWRWDDAQSGLRFAGARSQTWDTAFAARALLSCDLATGPSLRSAHRYLKSVQMVGDLPDHQREHRASIDGGWCFSDGQHRWPVSDCTAEALTAVLHIEAADGVIPAPDRLGEDRVRAAIVFLLDRQNDDGGFGTYEARRGGRWLDRLNPSEMFRDCMTERSYLECTASAIEALATVRRMHPALATDRVARALARSIAFLRGEQRADGSFAAAWGIRFTYAIFHAVKALTAAGVDPHDPAIARAVGWLERTQRADGGWGEHWSSCLSGEYVEHRESQAVMTSWALLALADAQHPSPAVDRAARWLESRRQADGSWPLEAVNGVFFGTAMLDYCLYRAYFPVWALAQHRRT